MSAVATLLSDLNKWVKYLSLCLLMGNRCKFDAQLKVIKRLLRKLPNSTNDSGTAIGDPLPSESRSIDSFPRLPSSTVPSTPARRHSVQSMTPSTCSVVDQVERLPPPGLVLRERTWSTKLQSKFEKSFVSGCGNFVGWLGRREYQIYEIRTTNALLVTSGNFQKRGEYRYGLNTLCSQFHQWPKRPKFCCAAITKDFCAIGTLRKLLVFAVRPGRLLGFESLPEADIKKLIFSPDGTELIALMITTTGSRSCVKVLVYSTSEFSSNVADSDNVLKQLHGFRVTKVWKDFIGHIVDATISREGTKIAICSSYNNEGYSQLRLLEKNMEGEWVWVVGTEKLSVSNGNIHSSPGITGISLYKPCYFCSHN